MLPLLAQPTPAIDPSNKSIIETPSCTSSTKGKIDGQSAELEMSAGDVLSVAWRYLTHANNRKPTTKLPAKSVQTSYFSDPGDKQLNVTWLGHSSLMINMDGYRLLIDPVFAKRISLLGPTRFNGDVPMDIHRLPLIDVVLISHDHYDHLNKYSVKKLIKKARRFVVPLAVGQRLIRWGVPAEKIIELDWWEVYQFDDKLTLVATPAQHFSGRGLTDRNRTLWASWVVRSPSHKIFFGGDSGYFSGFAQIGEKYGPFDMTFIECGAYNEAWSQIHMFPEQTVQAHLDLGGHILYPIHWGTFNLAMHSWYEPMERLTAEAVAAGVSVATPIVGETTIFGEKMPANKWWRQAMASR